MSRNLTVASSALATLFVVAACATIMHGTSQEVPISSQPTGATVTVDGKLVGTTPVGVRLPRKSSHRIVVTLEGYQPFEILTTRKTSGWVWGNLVFGGLIGLVVDASTGGLYDVRPEQIQSQLVTVGAQASVREGELYVFLVPAADPAWTKVGQLTPKH